MEDIKIEELKSRMDKGEELNLYDVREPWENEEFNIGGKNIPLGDLPGKLDELDHLRDEELLCYCRSGGRSGQAKAFLQNAGFKKVRNVLGGVLRWQELYEKN